MDLVNTAFLTYEILRACLGGHLELYSLLKLPLPFCATATSSLGSFSLTALLLLFNTEPADPGDDSKGLSGRLLRTWNTSLYLRACYQHFSILYLLLHLTFVNGVIPNLLIGWGGWSRVRLLTLKNHFALARNAKVGKYTIAIGGGAGFTWPDTID